VIKDQSTTLDDASAEELRARGMPLGMSYEEGEVSLAEGNCVLF
jgi:hypothetical protein